LVSFWSMCPTNKYMRFGVNLVYEPYKQIYALWCQSGLCALQTNLSALVSIWSMCPTNKSMRLRFGVNLVYVPYKQIYALWCRRIFEVCRNRTSCFLTELGIVLYAACWATVLRASWQVPESHFHLASLLTHSTTLAGLQGCRQEGRDAGAAGAGGP
jgi:hypothetical protein